MIVLPSKLYSHELGSLTLLEGGSVRYFINSIAMLFSIVEPPTPPIASGGRPPTIPFVGEPGLSGIIIAGHMLSTWRLPGAMELGQPGRGSNSAIPCPNTSPRFVTPTCAPNPPPMLNVSATQFPHRSDVEILQVPYRISFQCTRIGTLVSPLTAAVIEPARLLVSRISFVSHGGL